MIGRRTNRVLHREGLKHNATCGISRLARDVQPNIAAVINAAGQKGGTMPNWKYLLLILLVLLAITIPLAMRFR